jgi:transcriptional regulator with XRE-family HTH domain
MHLKENSHLMNTKTNTNSGADVSQLGIALRDIRKQRGMTLAETSELTKLPVSTLSKIENNRMSLSYDKLLRICEGLGIDIAQLFSADTYTQTAKPEIAGRRSVTRAGHGYTIETANYAHLYPAADLLKKRIVPIIAEVRTRSIKEFGELIRHPGEEYVFVLEGVVDLHTDLYAPTRLETGDSIYFDSAMGHAYIAVSPGICRVLSICSADTNQLIAAGARRDDPSSSQKGSVHRLLIEADEGKEILPTDQPRATTRAGNEKKPKQIGSGKSKLNAKPSSRTRSK